MIDIPRMNQLYTAVVLTKCIQLYCN